MKMNIHKNKMIWYNTRYCIRVSYEKKRLQIRGFQKFQQNGKNLCFCVEKEHQSRRNETENISDVTGPFEYWNYNEFIKISMLKSLEIKGFAGGNRENETWYRYYETDFINIHISY